MLWEQWLHRFAYQVFSYTLKVDIFEIGSTFCPFEMDGFIGIPPPESLSFSFSSLCGFYSQWKGARSSNTAKWLRKKTARPHNEFTPFGKETCFCMCFFLKTVGLEDPDEWMMNNNAIFVICMIWLNLAFLFWTNIHVLFRQQNFTTRFQQRWQHRVWWPWPWRPYWGHQLPKP